MSKLCNPDPELDFFYRSDTCRVYLLHFARPVHRAQHYVGSTEDLDRRLQEHLRVWPLYRIDEQTLTLLADNVPEPILEELESMHGKNYRWKDVSISDFYQEVYVCDSALA
jgi:hypothetical protein